MEPLAVDAALLRTVLAADIRLAVGRELMVRVASVTGDGRGVLSLAGLLLEAELPGHVHAGEELRLQVRELTPERVLLAIAPEVPTVPPTAEMAERLIPMPGGGSVRVTERDSRARRHPRPDARQHTVSLRYDAPTLGPVDLQFTLSDGGITLTVAVAAALARAADDHAEPLRSALAAATGRPANVTVLPRHEPLEVFA